MNFQSHLQAPVFVTTQSRIKRKHLFPRKDNIMCKHCYIKHFKFLKFQLFIGDAATNGWAGPDCIIRYTNCVYISGNTF